MTANLLTLNSSKTEFLLIGLKKQLDKIHNSSLNTTNSARNLGVSSCWQPLMNILLSPTKFRPSPKPAITILDCCILPSYLDSTTACTIATAIVHSKLDYCTSFCYYNLPRPKSQITSLQQIQNYLACAVLKAPQSCLITSILRSLHWLQITQRIEYKLSLIHI